MSADTLGFYNANAEDYAARARRPNPRLDAFLSLCRPCGKILELGTGGGIDAAAIIARGFDIDATDGSPRLAAIAARHIGRPVRTLLFQELEATDTYDGVYACASLTHAPRAQLGDAVARIYRSLKTDGIAWASFKAGTAEGSDALGRHYNYVSQAELTGLWHSAAAWQRLESEAWQGGAWDGAPTNWVAITAWK